jgi:hypothetical protein
MESELVAGLCELWLNFFLISKYINQVANGHLDLCWAHRDRCSNTISWVLGLMQYRNNNLDNIIGIISDLYCILVKYVDKIINPLNGNFCYKKRYYDLRNSSPIYAVCDLGINKPSGYIPMVYLISLNDKLYTWTSKIMDPSERYTPCVEIVPFGNYMEIHINCPYYPFNLNKGINLFYKSKPGNPMFNSLSLDAKYNELDILEDNFKIVINKSLKSERIVPLLNKRIKSDDNHSQNMSLEFWKKIKKGSTRADPMGRSYYSNNKVKRKITEKNKTKSRSNKWKYIISEKSRKHIILGCEGETYFEKLENFYNSWWNYYIIRKCNTGEILYEYHSPRGGGIKILHSRFVAPYEEFPKKINEFLNYSYKFRNYNLEKRIGIINDNTIDECTELYMYFNNRLRIEETNFDYFKLDYHQIYEPKYIESNIEQYYSYCNNISVYVGWVSIIRINNYSAQPTYYNNLIKRYHKEWVNMLKYWVDVPNYNLKWNSNTKMNNTNLLAITTNKNALPSPLFYRYFYKYQWIKQNNNCDPDMRNRVAKSVETQVKLIRNSNLSYELDLHGPFIPNKYQHKFNSVKITIKNIRSNDNFYNKYTDKGRRASFINKLPWGIKESIMNHIEKYSREFVKIRPKFK